MFSNIQHQNISFVFCFHAFFQERNIVQFNCVHWTFQVVSILFLFPFFQWIWFREAYSLIAHNTFACIVYFTCCWWFYRDFLVHCIAFYHLFFPSNRFDFWSFFIGQCNTKNWNTCAFLHIITSIFDFNFIANHQIVMVYGFVRLWYFQLNLFLLLLWNIKEI